MKRLIIFLPLVFVVACTSVSDVQQERRNIEEYYQSSGVTQYFLPMTPDWANRSETAACLRKEQVQFLDMPRLRKSLDLNYEQALQLQLGQTLVFKEMKKKITHRPLSAKETETIFYTALDRVKSGIVEFRVPDFKRVHIIWVDEFFLKRRAMSELQGFMETRAMQKGHPVFLSLCASRTELEEFLAIAKLNNQNIRLISSELFSPFNAKMELMPYDRFHIDHVFSKEQEIHFYTPDKKAIPELEGQYKTHLMR